MGNWIIRWNFNKELYAPGETAQINLWLENTGDTYLYVSEFGLEFDFGFYNLVTISGTIPPRKNQFLGNVSISLPYNAIGRKIFRLQYRMSDYINNSWIDIGFFKPDNQYSISVYPRPFYQAFVSRGLRTEDRVIGDPIAEMIREWGFTTITIGIERQVPIEQVTMAVREEIRRAQAIIAIATPRYMDALTGLWKTLEWAHGEIGIAFGINKPLLILKDRSVSLGGLPSYLETQRQIPVIEYNPYNMEELRNGLYTVMPGFREWTESNVNMEFFDGLGKIAIGGLAVVGGIAILSGFMGTLAETSKK